MTDAITRAAALIEREYPGQVAKMFADFIDAHIPYAALDDDSEVVANHAVIRDLCVLLDRAGLPRPLNMQQR